MRFIPFNVGNCGGRIWFGDQFHPLLTIRHSLSLHVICCVEFELYSLWSSFQNRVNLVCCEWINFHCATVQLQECGGACDQTKSRETEGMCGMTRQRETWVWQSWSMIYSGSSSSFISSSSHKFTIPKSYFYVDVKTRKNTINRTNTKKKVAKMKTCCIFQPKLQKKKKTDLLLLVFFLFCLLLCHRDKDKKTHTFLIVCLAEVPFYACPPSVFCCCCCSLCILSWKTSEPDICKDATQVYAQVLFPSFRRIFISISIPNSI